jgi:hypothetical protein
MNRQELIMAYNAWKAERVRLSEAENNGEPYVSGGWTDSDDDAVDLLNQIAEHLLPTSEEEAEDDSGPVEPSFPVSFRKDGTCVVFIDTGEMPENSEGPNMVVYINDDFSPIFDNPVTPGAGPDAYEE